LQLNRLDAMIRKNSNDGETNNGLYLL